MSTLSAQVPSLNQAALHSFVYFPFRAACFSEPLDGRVSALDGLRHMRCQTEPWFQSDRALPERVNLKCLVQHKPTETKREAKDSADAEDGAG